MRCNLRMRALVHEVLTDPANPARLPNSLTGLIGSGLTSSGDAMLLASPAQSSPHVHRDSFADATGYECFINHVHIEDYAPGLKPAELLSCAIAFSCKVVNHALPLNSDLRFIISIDNKGCTWRFHRVRSGEDWVAGDLESYGEEAILVLDSSECGDLLKGLSTLQEH